MVEGTAEGMHGGMEELGKLVLSFFAPDSSPLVVAIPLTGPI